MRVDIIPPDEYNLIRIMRKIFQNDDKEDKLTGVDMTFEEALKNLKLEREKRKIKIKRIESEIEKGSISEEQRDQLLRKKYKHDEWKDLIENTLNGIE